MDPRRFFLFLTGSFLCLYLVFSSTVTIPYVRHDSVRYFHKFYNHEKDAPTNPQYEWEKAVGRPIVAEIEAFIYKKINHLSDLSRLRLITIAIFALSAALLASIIAAQGFEAVEALCISVTIFTLPGIQECIFVPFFPLALAALLSMSAYAILASSLVLWLRLALSFTVLEIAFLSYPPSTFFFLIPTAFFVVLQNKSWLETRKIWARDMFLWGLAAVVYWLALKIFFYASIKSSGHDIVSSWGFLLRNIETFLPLGLSQSFNLWNIYFSKPLGVSLMIITTLSLVVDYFRRKDGRGQRILAIVVMVLTLNLVWFLYGGYLPRHFVASQALALILLYWSGRSIGNKWWLVLLMLIGVLSANTTTTRNVLNSHSELMFIRSRLIPFADTSTKDINVIRPKDGATGYNGLPCVYDNFNCTSMAEFEIPDLIRVALLDTSDPPTEIHCMATVSNYGEELAFSPHMLIIDMNDLVTISKVHGR